MSSDIISDDIKQLHLNPKSDMDTLFENSLSNKHLSERRRILLISWPFRDIRVINN